MIDESLFQIGLYGVAIFSVISGIYFTRTKTDNISSREKLARNVLFGTVVIAIGLAWCVPVSKPIAPKAIIPYMTPLAVVLTILGYKLLDYHFSRGIGGVIILTSSFLLSNIWAFCSPEDSLIPMLFSLLTFIFAIIGLFISGKPYLLRDWFRNCATSKRIKIATISFFVAYASMSVLLALTLK